MMGIRALRPAHAQAIEKRHHVTEVRQAMGMPPDSTRRQSARVLDRLRMGSWFASVSSDAERARRAVPAPNKNSRIDSWSRPTLMVNTAVECDCQRMFWEHAKGRDPSKTQGDRDASCRLESLDHARLQNSQGDNNDHYVLEE